MLYILFVLFYCWVVFHGQNVLQFFNCSSVEGHWFFSIWGLLKIKLLGSFVYKFLCECKTLISPDKCPRVKLLGLVISACLTLEETAVFFSSVAVLFHISLHQQYINDSVSSNPCLHLVLSLFILAFLIDVQWYLIVVKLAFL